MTSGQYSCQIFINRDFYWLDSIFFGVKLSVKCKPVPKKIHPRSGDLYY